jgi:hypothetical protein
MGSTEGEGNMGTTIIEIGPYVRRVIDETAAPYEDLVRRLHDERRLSDAEVEGLRQAVERARKQTLESDGVLEAIE